MIKRIFLFLLVNFCVMVTLSLILSFFNITPYLQSYGLNVKQLLIFCLIWGMGGAFISLCLSKIMAKWFMGVHIIGPQSQDPELQRLVSTVHSLARQAGLPDMPEVGIYESQEVNAFATGPTKRSSLVAVSRGLLNKMGKKELEGVLGHEIAHIANGDMVTLTLIQGVVNAFVMFLARILAFVFSGLGRSRDNNSPPSPITYMVFVFLFEIVFMILGSIVVAFFSRYREYRADRGGADLAGKSNMIAALQSLQKLQFARDPAAEKPAYDAMKINTPPKSNFLMLFATHPPLEKRIERLNSL
jgi:heat shock protein HtpX